MDYKHPEELKSCDKCYWTNRNENNRYGCPWRSEITMFEDKSPCLNYQQQLTALEGK